MKKQDVLNDAILALEKASLEPHREAIAVLRDKGYTWREISDFLATRGIQAEHTKIFRFFNKPQLKVRKVIMTVISAYEYGVALGQISITDKQRSMLKAHFDAPNRSITYTELANAAGYEDHAVANRQYGKLGRDLGEAVDFQFADSTSRRGEKFYSSSLGMPNPYTTGDFQLVMHHELAKAIAAINFFD